MEFRKKSAFQLEQWFPKCGRRIPRSSTRCQEIRGYSV